MELSNIAKITHLFLKLFFAVGCITTPFVYKIIELLELPDQMYRTILYTLLSIGCLMIVYQVIKIFKSIVLGNPFVTENEIALKKIAVLCEVIALILIIKLVVEFTIINILLIFIVVTFGIAGLCAYVLSQLFKQSVFLKEENDMTI